jgi:hypothetical protein
MPPIRIESWQKSANQESRILLALSNLKESHISSIHTAAKLYNIPFATLQAHTDSWILHVDKRPSGHKLTQIKEDSLTE